MWLVQLVTVVMVSESSACTFEELKEVFVGLFCVIAATVAPFTATEEATDVGGEHAQLVTYRPIHPTVDENVDGRRRQTEPPRRQLYSSQCQGKGEGRGGRPCEGQPPAEEERQVEIDDEVGGPEQQERREDDSQRKQGLRVGVAVTRRQLLLADLNGKRSGTSKRRRSNWRTQEHWSDC